MMTDDNTPDPPAAEENHDTPVHTGDDPPVPSIPAAPATQPVTTIHPKHRTSRSRTPIPRHAALPMEDR